MTLSYDDWLAGGRRIPLPRLGHAVFVRLDGPVDGPVVTLLHGFPTSSYDWAGVVPALTAAGWRVLSLDFLGFGESDKPTRHRYAITEQTDLVEEVWQVKGIDRSAVVAHNYAVCVAQELLSRAGEGPAVTVDGVVFLNGGVYPDLHRPLRVQRLLRSPAGPLLARVLSERVLARSLATICAKPLGSAIVHDLWRAVSSRNGRATYHRLLHYIDDRAVSGQRWVSAMESAGVPLAFVWGPQDPVSGGHVLARLRERLPGAGFAVFDDVGHYPQLEAPERVGPALAGLLGGR
ncbi:alpha/beta fold hydrolase [Actinomycetes bacterium KLBMP 9797]